MLIRIGDNRCHMKYQTVFVGGTFDRLHRGHEAVLVAAFTHGEKVVIGLTSDEFVAKFKFSPTRISSTPRRWGHVLPFSVRKGQLSDWLIKHDYVARAMIVALEDPYEPAASAHYDALVVTADNKKRGEEINKRRQVKGFTQVVLIEVPIVPANDGMPISATRIRNGEIDANGRLVMPDALRPELQMPLGPVLPGAEIVSSLAKNKDRVIASVGDMTTKILLDAGCWPSLAVIDGKVGRKLYPDAQVQLREGIRPCEVQFTQVTSGPGYIAKSAIDLIKKWSSQQFQLRQRVRPWEVKAVNFVIEVDGEEDLLTLPVIVYSPIDSIVYYGQPPSAGQEGGLAEVMVTSRIKLQAQELLNKFNFTSDRI